MNSDQIIKSLLEDEEDDFNVEDYLKKGGEEASTVLYDGPAARITQPLNAHAVNDYITGFPMTDKSFLEDAERGPLYTVFDKTVESTNPNGFAVTIHLASGRFYDDRGRAHYLYELKRQSDLSPEAYADMEVGFSQILHAQIKSKKGDPQEVVNDMIALGLTDQAMRYGRYFDIEKLPIGKAVALTLDHMRTGKRPSPLVTRFMQRQKDVKFEKNGFWLLFDDWADTASFFDSSGRNNYENNAETLFNGDAHDWFNVWDGIDVGDVWDYIEDKNINTIRQLLDGRYCVNDLGDEYKVTPEILADLDDDEVKELVCSDANNSGATEDIYDLIKRAGVFAEESGLEAAYIEGYEKAFERALKVRDTQWIRVPDGRGGESHKLAFLIRYPELEEWMRQNKDDDNDDSLDVSVKDLALTYAEKASPNDDYSGDFDKDYFNSLLRDDLSNLKPGQPVRQAPPAGQKEMELNDPPSPPRELEDTATVRIGEPPEEKAYPGVPERTATEYVQRVPRARMTAEALIAQLLEDEDEDEADPKEYALTMPRWIIRTDDRYLWCAPDGSSGGPTVDIAKAAKFYSKKEAVETAERLDIFNRWHYSYPRAVQVSNDGGTPVVLESAEDGDDPKELALDLNMKYALRYTGTGDVLYLVVGGGMPTTWTRRLDHATLMDTKEAANELSCWRDEEHGPDVQFDLVPVNNTVPESLQEAVYKRSTTQIDLPDDIANHLLQWSKLNIPDEDLYIDEDGGCGREDEMHVTCLYGLLDAQPSEALARIVGSTKPFEVEMGAVSLFENPNYDVVKVAVKSDELTKLSDAIRAACKNDNKFPTFNGHCTLAYVKSGLGSKYAGMDAFEGAKVPRVFWAESVKFKGAGDSEDGSRVVDILYFDREGDPAHPVKKEPVTENEEDDVDPKAFVQSRVSPVHTLQIEGDTYTCSCGKWGYRPNMAWSNAIANAKADFRRHKRQSRFKPVREDEVDDGDPKEIALNVASSYVIRYIHSGGPSRRPEACYWSGQGMHWYRNINDAKLMCRAEANANYVALTSSNYSTDELSVVPVFVDNGKVMLAENAEDDADPKQFIADQPYRIRHGIGARTKYLRDWGLPGQPSYRGVWIDDPDEATQFSQADAVERLGEIGKLYGARIEMCESEDAYSVEESATESDPFDDDGLPQEVTSFLRKKRQWQRRPQARPVI